MSAPLAPIPGHDLRVTPNAVRTYLDCTCDTPPQTVHASTRSAERAALRHYIDHAPDGPEKERAKDLVFFLNIERHHHTQGETA